jgi:two-component system sensor histidine kinase AtoS
MLAVSVTDTGVGIPEADQAHVFEPFYTTRPEGTGLGLFISRKIVANHGGRITVRSSPGKGSTFSVRLPLHKPEDA